jgi:NTP pyrophosphatase (non-canonical NTP hydrolase)
VFLLLYEGHMSEQAQDRQALNELLKSVQQKSSEITRLGAERRQLFEQVEQLEKQLHQLTARVQRAEQGESIAVEALLGAKYIESRLKQALLSVTSVASEEALLAGSATLEEIEHARKASVAKPSNGEDTQVQTLNAMAQECYAISASKGWHVRAACDAPGNAGTSNGNPSTHPVGVDYDRVGALLALITSEVSEALEALREDSESQRTLQMYFVPGKDGKPKPEGVAVELVDVLIRCFDLAGALGLDLDTAYATKLVYNRARPQRHGGKHL